MSRYWWGYSGEICEMVEERMWFNSAFILVYNNWIVINNGVFSILNALMVSRWIMKKY